MVQFVIVHYYYSLIAKFLTKYIFSYNYLLFFIKSQAAPATPPTTAPAVVTTTDVPAIVPVTAAHDALVNAAPERELIAVPVPAALSKPAAPNAGSTNGAAIAVTTPPIIENVIILVVVVIILVSPFWLCIYYLQYLYSSTTKNLTKEQKLKDIVILICLC